MDTPVLEQAAKVLETVCDPEIPVLSIGDLGIIRGLQWNAAEGLLTVTITPTYSGCPAMGIIEAQIHEALGGAGFSKVCVQTVLQPAWTTGWLTEAGREKLRAFGIAPPELPSADKLALTGQTRVLACPHCGSCDTEMISQFGSTACKALFRCLDCREPFDYFKCL